MFDFLPCVAGEQFDAPDFKFSQLMLSGVERCRGDTMKSNIQAAPHGEADEQRGHERIVIATSGKLFVPAEESTIDCQVVNLSAGGAAVQCSEPPPLNSFIVLYIDGFGRFEGVATRFVNGELGLCFVCKDAKRQRLQNDLNSFVIQGDMSETRLRRHKRAASSATGFYNSPAGEFVPCDVIDISLQGISLRTNGRPSLGAIVDLGRTKGRVIRHHEDGIAIQFLNVVTDTERPNHGGCPNNETYW